MVNTQEISVSTPMPTSAEANIIREKLAVLRRNRGLLILFCLSAALSSLALTYIYAERYHAVTTVIYRPTESIRFHGREAQALGFPVPMLPFEVIGQTISQIGTSEVILRQVVERLHLDMPEKKEYTGFAKLYHDVKDTVKDYSKKTWQVLKYGRTIEENRTSAAILQLAKDATIEADRKDYTARIEVVDKDPVRAAKIVDEIGTVLVAFIKQESVAPARQQREELDRMMDSRKNEIDAVRKEMEDLRASRKIVSFKEEVTLNLKSADEFDRELRLNEKEIAGARSRLEALKAQRAALSSMIKESETVEQDPVYDRLRQLRAEREARLEGLLKRYPGDHVEVLAARAELKAIEDSLAEVTPKRVGSETTQINELYQKASADEMEAQAELAGLQAAGETLRKDLAELKARFLEPAVETRLDDLAMRLSTLEGTYQQLATAREEMRIAELQSEGEIRVLHPATPQDAPFRPIKVYHVVTSAVLALILGIGLAYVFDFWRSIKQAGVPVEAAHV